jgi:hypothetical protein
MTLLLPKTYARAALAALLCGAFVCAPARAEFTLKAAQIMVRILGFMDHPPPAQVSLGLVYDPASPASQKQAENLMAQLGGGYQAGKFTLVPKLVKIGGVSATSVDVIVLMDGVGGAAKIADVMKAKKIPCFTGDIAQVNGGACLIGITTDPKVNIQLNRNLAVQSGINFGSAFHMMITEI